MFMGHVSLGGLKEGLFHLRSLLGCELLRGALPGDLSFGIPRILVSYKYGTSDLLG